MFSYTGLAEVDMTKVTVALCYSGPTKVTPGHVLGTVMWVHFRVPTEKKSINIISSLWALILMFNVGGIEI